MAVRATVRVRWRIAFNEPEPDQESAYEAFRVHPLTVIPRDAAGMSPLGQFYIAAAVRPERKSLEIGANLTHVADKTHIAPIWRDKADFIIGVDLRDSEHSEQLWARRVADRRFELCCIPLYAYDLALGDVVETDSDHNVVRIVEPSGRYVFRVWSAAAPEAAEPVLGQLAAMGCLIEQGSAHLFAVDAKDATLARAVGELLAEEESRTELAYGTGRT